jgi:hypothetical protein
VGSEHAPTGSLRVGGDITIAALLVCVRRYEESKVAVGFGRETLGLRSSRERSGGRCVAVHWCELGLVMRDQGPGGGGARVRQEGAPDAVLSWLRGTGTRRRLLAALARRTEARAYGLDLGLSGLDLGF